MERAHAQWADDHTAHAVRRQRSFQFRLVPALGQPPRSRSRTRRPSEPPQGESKRTRRRRVEPLDVVDGDQSRSASLRSCSASCTATASVRRSTGSPDTSSRSSATSSARRLGVRSAASTSSMTPRGDLPAPTFPRPRSASAGRDERTRQSACARVLDRRSQSVDFPTPASPSSTRSGASLRLVDEGVEGGEFVPADDLEHHAAERS